MNETRRKLMTLSEDGARKPEELDGEAVWIVNSMETRTPDGRTTFKWVVRRENGETTVFWAAGQNPSLQVDQWFRDNQGTPLYCRLYRQANKYNTMVWHIEQLDEENAVPAQSNGAHPSIDDQLNEVGL